METIKETDPPKRMRTVCIVICVLICLFVLTRCAVVGLVGPFTGKVVDVETKEPVAGAAVVIWFHTASASIGGPVYHVADTFETLTAKNGDFKIPLKLVAPLELFHAWDKDFQITIFKPGYGTYPENINTYCSSKIKKRSYSFLENKQIYYLPKLSTIEERLQNLKNTRHPKYKSSEKVMEFKRLRDEEKSAMGLGS